MTAAALILGACGNGVSVSNSNPRGTVGGQLLDASTMQPLAGVGVTLNSAIGMLQTTSGTDGYYRIEDVPAGDFALDFDKEMFVHAQVLDALDGSVGNFPVKNPQRTVSPIALLPVGPSFVVRLVDGGGAAVEGVKVTARGTATALRVAGPDRSLQVFGTQLVSATSDAAGRVVFDGLPDPSAIGSVAGEAIHDPATGNDLRPDAVVVTVPPVQVAGQDVYSYAGGLFPFDRLSLGSTLPQIVLAGPTDPLRIVESNVPWLENGFQTPSAAHPVNATVVPLAGPITIAFSEAIDPATLRADLVTENGNPGPTLTPKVDLNYVVLTPAGQLVAGTRYDLVLSATAVLSPDDGDRHRNVIAPVFAAPAGAPTVTAKVDGTTVTFTISEPIGVGDGQQQSYACVVFYEGVDLDGSGPNLAHVAGESDPVPSNLVCGTTSPVTPPLLPVTVNASTLAGNENAGAIAGAPLTGYASKLTAKFERYQTTAADDAPGSTVPTAGTKGHLYFSRLSATVRRVTGQPLGDLAFTIQ